MGRIGFGAGKLAQRRPAEPVELLSLDEIRRKIADDIAMTQRELISYQLTISNFVAAADRLLLEYPGKLGYYVRRLGF